MPLLNEIFGVFKVVKVQGNTVLVKNASQNKTMDVGQENYIQGTAESRILNFGSLSETISVSAPILIGPAKNIDGRKLLNDQIVNAANPSNTNLPILKSASISIDAETGGSVDLTMQSDGTKIASIFSVTNDTTPTELDPTGPGGPSRVAKNVDFGVRFGPYESYVQKATIKVEVDTQSTVFLAQVPDATQVDYMGSVFPFLGVAGIKVSGEGTAAVNVGKVNDPQQTGSEDLTLQFDDQDGALNNIRGHVYSTTKDFVLGVYDDNSLKDLFVDANGDTLVNLSKAVINSTGFNVTTGIITVSFGFTAWVKIF